MKWLNGSPRKDFQWRRAPLPAEAYRGKKIAVIGGTNGIGRALARALVARGAEVTVVGRTFRDAGLAGLHLVPADLSEMKQALSVAQELPVENLDLMILTTGITAGKRRAATPEGIELDLAVSYLSRFVIVRETASRLGQERAKSNDKPRVFIMGFPGANQRGDLEDFNSETSYHPTTAHANTVVGNEALVLDSARRYPNADFYGLNPGLMKSNILTGLFGENTVKHRFMQAILGAFFPSTSAYAETIVPLLISPDLEEQSGAMFNRHGNPIEASDELTRGTKVAEVIGKSIQLAARALGQASQ